MVGNRTLYAVDYRPIENGSKWTEAFKTIDYDNRSIVVLIILILSQIEFQATSELFDETLRRIVEGPLSVIESTPASPIPG